jgi:hypothetical protein
MKRTAARTRWRVATLALRDKSFILTLQSWRPEIRNAFNRAGAVARRNRAFPKSSRLSRDDPLRSCFRRITPPGLVICGIERRKNTMVKFASHGVAQRPQNHPTIFPPPAAPRRNSVCGSGCAGIAAAKDGAHPNRGIVSPRFRSCPRLRGRALSSNVFVLCTAHDLRQLGIAGVIGHDYNRLQGSARRNIAECVTAGGPFLVQYSARLSRDGTTASPYRYRGRASRPVTIRSNPADAERFPRAPFLE